MSYSARSLSISIMAGMAIGAWFMHELQRGSKATVPQVITLEFKGMEPLEEDMIELDPFSTETERDSVTGIIRSTTPYQFGMREGIAYKYDEQGCATERMEYHNDLPDGEFSFWEEGRLICTGKNREGRLVELKRIEGDSVITQNFPYEETPLGIDIRPRPNIEI